jgi:hypothetical protein
MDNHPTIEALKATAPHRFSPMPWKPDTAPGDDEPMIRDANGDDVGRFAVAEDRNHALSATLAAPHLLARVAELEAEKAALQDRLKDLFSAAEEVAEVARLRGEDNPPNDGRLWVSRWQNAIATLTDEVDNG